MRKHYRTCTLCEAMCGVEITLDGDQITAIRGDKADPFSRGHICPKAIALQDIHADPNRLKQPQLRKGDGWQTIGWDEAFDLAADGIRRVQQQHGDSAVGIYLGNPNVHNLGSMLFGGTLIKALRTPNRFSATSVDQLPHQFVARLMFGHQLMLPIADVDRSDYMLILGANPLVSNGSLLTAGGIEPRLKRLQQRGGKLVVIDPRRSETAQLADEHHFIEPGSDVLLLLALLYVILSEDLAQPGRLLDFSDGYDSLPQLVADFTPERCAPVIGIDAATVRRLAREFAGADAAVAYGRMGLSTQTYGSLCQWLINLLNIVSGNLDRPGGALFTTPAVDIIEPRRAGRYHRWHSRVSGLPEIAGELPVAVLAEEILTPGDGQIRAMVTVAGNPVLSTPNGGQLDTALASLDFMLSLDIYINETTRHADLILPSTTALESDHYDLIFNTLALRNTAKWSPALFEPSDEQRHDWQIARELTRRLADAERPFDSRDARNVLTPAQAIDFGLRSGPYELTLDDLKANPHGIDLGPLQPRLPQRLFTKEKRIDLTPPLLVDDLPRARELFAQRRNGGLRLIGRRQLRSNNSWMHNSRRLVRGRERCTLLIHPQDAAARAIGEGGLVEVSSRVGRIRLAAEISDEMMPGVVSIPHGWGHDRDGVQLDVAGQHAGASINDLTDETLRDELTGNAAFSGVPVMVAALANGDTD